VLFQVPARLRPANWPPTFPLPLTPPREGRLDDVVELGRIVEDAERLYSELQAARAGHAPAPAPYSLPWLLAAYKERPRWLRLAERTKAQYDGDLFPELLRWSAAGGHPDLRALTGAEVEDWLLLFADRPTKARHLRAALSALLTTGVALGMLERNVCETLRLPTPQRGERTLWRPADVAHYVAVAEAVEWPGGAVLVQGLWETMGRVSDAMGWRREQVRDGVLSYTTSKTGERVTAPLSPALLRRIEAGGEWLVTDRAGQPYRPVVDDNRMGKDFAKLAHVVGKDGGLRLQLRHLRHSATTHATEAGATLEMLRSLTGHRTEAMLEQVYAQRTYALAHTVQRLRGLVENLKLGHSQKFDARLGGSWT